MSEPEPETPEIATPPAPEPEPEPEPEPDPDEELAPDEETDEEQPEPEPAPEPPAGMSEKELEAGRKKLEAEAARHRNRISEIMGEEALLLDQCPLCSGFVDGWIFPQPPPPDVIEKVRVAIGMPDLSNYQPAKHAHMCPDCAGLGVVLSGSLVQGNVAIDCDTCHASGYVVTNTQTGELTAPEQTNGSTPPPLPAGVNEDDPAVKSLRARGFSVFPPPAPLPA